jgi:hypothetical protein
MIIRVKVSIWSGFIALTVLAGTWIAAIASDVFVIDSSRSSLSLSGNVVGGTIEAQGPGGLTTTFSGSLQVELTGTSIQVMPGSQIDAQTNGVWQPAPGGKSGSAPADYGGKAQAMVGFFPITAKAALRDILLDVTSAAIPLENGQFDASGFLFAFAPTGSSALDYDAGLMSGSKKLSELATNKVTTMATVTNVGAGKTLTIPINASAPFKLLTANDSLLILQGQLVATSQPNSTLRINLVKVESGQLVLEWDNQPGKEFQVETATNLNTWAVAAANITGSGPTVRWSTPLSGARGFYRVGMK